MTDDPEQRLPPRLQDDVVEEPGIIIAREDGVSLEIDGMGRDGIGPGPEPGEDDGGEEDNSDG